jgi:hypothetical protein
MTMILDGNGSITGLVAGGLPDATVTAADIVDASITAAKLSQPLTLGTAQAATSGTSIDFTGIPSWAKRITLMLGVVSTSGTSDLLVQGGAGSIDTATYNDVVSGIVGTAVGSTTVTTIGFRLTPSVTAATTNSGQLVMTLIGSNRWAVTHTLTRNDGIVAIGGGDKLFSGTLDRIRLTTVNGTDTFDGGSMNILCEG